ncbi:ZIP family metal transporter [Pseudoduganella namucuonensis]|uniref:Zinc transporter, ZIP family n=1 Tax=Pseudoduganella namucuonensis TaxID=1035707 RepID=A0A1I7JU74_9BURK|nr:ZIP family metal transporter [Pseudoduganella namucuonensis]SFU88761.1 zinc transporter, ZIP family [Pseudoduganella namucuonensis]
MQAARTAPRWHWRLALGAAIGLAGAAVLLRDFAALVAGLEPGMRGALNGGAMAALATATGTLPVLCSQTLSQRTYDAFLGFGAGVMLAATAFSLVLPSIAASRGAGAGPFTASGVTGAGILLGAALVLGLGRLVHANRPPADMSAERADSLKRAWLFVAAVAIHNLPEGAAIGVAFGGIDPLKAQSLATGIAVQDIPEGMVVALALRTVGYGRVYAALMGTASGLVEPVAAVAAAAVIDVSAGVLPWGLAIAAGAMLFVICHDVVPESHRNGNRASASSAVVVGFITMMMLDTALS